MSKATPSDLNANLREALSSLTTAKAIARELGYAATALEINEAILILDELEVTK